MKSDNPITQKMLYASLGEAVAVVEKMIESAVERDVRDALVRRLAALDQRIARLRDTAGC